MKKPFSIRRVFPTQQEQRQQQQQQQEEWACRQRSPVHSFKVPILGLAQALVLLLVYGLDRGPTPVVVASVGVLRSTALQSKNKVGLLFGDNRKNQNDDDHKTRQENVQQTQDGDGNNKNKSPIVISGYRTTYDDPPILSPIPKQQQRRPAWFRKGRHRNPTKLQQWLQQQQQGPDTPGTATTKTPTTSSSFFTRFQSPASVKASLDECRSRSSFRRHVGNDGRTGWVCSTTQLFGNGRGRGIINGHDDWVLAESEQIARSCTTHDVVRAFLTEGLQKRYNADRVTNVHFTLCRRPPRRHRHHHHRQDKPNASHNSRACDRWWAYWSSHRRRHEEKESRDDGRHCFDKDRDDDDNSYQYYQQDLELRSQWTLGGPTGPMRYSQKLVVDKIGAHGYSCLIQLLEDDNDNEEEPDALTSAKIRGRRHRRRMPTTHKRTRTNTKRPFESLYVYVGLQPHGEKDVYIYAAGLFRVNRQIVPNLVVFDASHLAGNLAGKGTLWLSAHFDGGDDNRSQQCNNSKKKKMDLPPAQQQYPRVVPHA